MIHTDGRPTIANWGSLPAPSGNALLDAIREVILEREGVAYRSGYKQGRMHGRFERWQEYGLALSRVYDERLRQDRKWGSQRHLAHERWYTILGEEVGEVGKAILEEDLHNLREELTQVAAVAVAFGEAIDRELAR